MNTLSKKNIQPDEATNLRQLAEINEYALSRIDKRYGGVVWDSFAEELAHRQISQLSGGQQQRTFLARALVQSANIYLMDEPFAAVDAATEQSIIQVLRQQQSQGKTILVVHHDLHTVPEYFDNLILLNVRAVAWGTMQTTFTPENLRRTYGGRLTLLEEVTEAMRRRSSTK